LNSLPRVHPPEREVNYLHAVPRYTVRAALTARPYTHYVGLTINTYTMDRGSLWASQGFWEMCRKEKSYPFRDSNHYSLAFQPTA